VKETAMDAWSLWMFLPLGYLLTVTIETPILLLGLSKRHSLGSRFFAGLWLTACTYPIVVLVLPMLLSDASRSTYLALAESFAPVAECLLFWAAFGSRQKLGRLAMSGDFAAIIVANLASWLVGGALV
jgi:hypothetical protein